MYDIIIQLPFPSLLQNAWDRMHFTARKRHMQTIATAIAATVRPPRKPIERCLINVVRRSSVRPDDSNVIGGLKPILDVLCLRGKPNKLGHFPHPYGLGFIVDDNPKCIVGGVDIWYEKCKRGQGSTQICITEIGPAGMFGAASIERDLQSADKAVMSGDAVSMLKAHNKLKEIIG